jgi:hypothetical protein
MGTDPVPALKRMISESRSGPRDVLRRIEIQLKAYPNESITPEALNKTIDSYAEACFAQMVAAYDRQYPGLCRASLVLFEGRDFVTRSAIPTRLEQMIAVNSEVTAFKDQMWAQDPDNFANLLVQFGLVAVQVGSAEILPFHAAYLDEATKSEARLICIPGLRSRLRLPSPSPRAAKKRTPRKR